MTRTTKSGVTIIDDPVQIVHFALLRIYHKLKMEVENPSGPKWRYSPMLEAIEAMKDNDVICTKRRKKTVLAEYKTFLQERNVLRKDD